MADQPEVVQQAARAEQPPITRMTSVVQQLSRLRDEFTRGKDPGGRREAARMMVERAEDLRAVVAEVVREAVAPPTDPMTGTVQTAPA